MSQQYTATGNYSDGTAQDVTATATWSSSAPGVASVSAGGLAQAGAEGTTTVKAQVGPISGTQTLRVSRLRHIVVQPTLNLMRPGGVQSYEARGTSGMGLSRPSPTT